MDPEPCPYARTIALNKGLDIDGAGCQARHNLFRADALRAPLSAHHGKPDDNTPSDEITWRSTDRTPGDPNLSVLTLCNTPQYRSRKPGTLFDTARNNGAIGLSNSKDRDDLSRLQTWHGLRFAQIDPLRKNGHLPLVDR